MHIAKLKVVAVGCVKQAGIRLAHLLNQAFDPAYTGPIKKIRAAKLMARFA